MQIKVEEIISNLRTEIISVFGNYKDVYIKYLRSPEFVDKYTLDWINPVRLNKQELAELSRARVVITDKSVVFSQRFHKLNKVLIQVKNPRLAIALVAAKFFLNKQLPGRHESALIHPYAKLGKDIFIGANVSIGKCQIGNNVTIFPNVIINDNVTIGDYVIIKPGAILGFDGFGYERNSDGNLIKFPQLGRLIIKDNVEIGSNSCIDKGSLSDTIIGSNTKISNLCQIAHNVVIGTNVIITSHVIISGSTVIEDDVWIAPNSSFRGHQIIGKGAIIGMGSVVLKDVPAGETWVGNPAKKIE